MQAYATHERSLLGDQPPRFDRTSPTQPRQAPIARDSDRALIDQVLGRLADLLVDRLMERTETPGRNLADT
jgi:hypothetical protein